MGLVGFEGALAEREVIVDNNPRAWARAIARDFWGKSIHQIGNFIAA